MHCFGVPIKGRWHVARQQACAYTIGKSIDQEIRVTFSNYPSNARQTFSGMAMELQYTSIRKAGLRLLHLHASTLHVSVMLYDDRRHGIDVHTGLLPVRPHAQLWGMLCRFVAEL